MYFFWLNLAKVLSNLRKKKKTHWNIENYCACNIFFDPGANIHIFPNYSLIFQANLSPDFSVISRIAGKPDSGVSDLHHMENAN